jgi:hypothetical protein
MAALKTPITPHHHILGPANAPITLVEYGDYECVHCGRAHQIVKLIVKQFGNRLRFVFRHFPLKQVHPNAETAAESAEYGAARGIFWEMHRYLSEPGASRSSAVFRPGWNAWSVGIGPSPSPGERDFYAEGPRRLPGRGTQWGEWSPDILHQWRSA